MTKERLSLKIILFIISMHLIILRTSFSIDMFLAVINEISSSWNSLGWKFMIAFFTPNHRSQAYKMRILYYDSWVLASLVDRCKRGVACKHCRISKQASYDGSDMIMVRSLDQYCSTLKGYMLNNLQITYINNYNIR